MQDFQIQECIDPLLLLQMTASLRILPGLRHRVVTELL